MVNFLGPSYSNLNADSNQSLFNEVFAHNYDYLTNYDGITNLNFRDSTNDQQVSLMFTLGVARAVTSVDVWMKATAVLAGNVTLTLFPEGASVGIPATAGSLGASSAVDAATISVTGYAKIKFTFVSPISLNAGNNYYAVLTSTVDFSLPEYIQIASDATPVGFVRSAKYNGAVWTAQTYTSCFIVYYKTTTKVSQGFRLSGNQKLDSVILYGAKTGAPSGNLILEIRNDNAGVPASTGPTNGISSPVTANAFVSPQTFTFPVQPDLLDGVKYHLVLSNSAAMISSAYVQVSTDSTSPTFGDGKVSVDNLDGTWRTVEQDAIFSIYYFEQVAPNTLGDELAELGDPPLDCRAQQVWLKSLTAALSSFFPSILPPLYGGNGTGEYAAGDMLYASSAHQLEKLPIGTTGQLLGVTTGGLPGWGAGGANQVLSLRNDEVFTLNVGDVVVYALSLTTTDGKAIKTSTKIADRMFAGVVQETIPPGEYGPVVVGGIAQVRVNGTVVAGNFLDTSSTSRRAFLCDYGPIRAMRGGGSGTLVYCAINPQLSYTPYAAFAEIQAFNVNGTSLTTVTWTAVGLNTEQKDTHSLLSVASNQITVATGGEGVYRVRAASPLIGTNTISTALTRLRKITGGGSDLIIGKSAGGAVGNTTIHTELSGEVTLVAGDVMEFQMYATLVALGTAGRAHSVTGFSNVYTQIEFEKIS